ncbi:hypothetical protein Poli38472_004906 [Pythium oligandrum]|uniref:Uncharacterized protein n=1 Tax=Pythium oligandrum TaxID=41045 RepID=A0A8K1FHK3_PYTOL|nr:hypothetical protein Poli38472_004906 [Pythium oligandrum]|eukprot:TMW59837.1 hypothetical protein Poli38472_004906 [Pythium oligandrum]
MSEDAATLEAALELIDALDADATNHQCVVEAESMTVQGDTEKNDRKRGRKKRDPRRNELDELRNEAQKLEETLGKLKQRRITPDSSSGNVWEEMAERQQRKRQLAESENARLRSLLDSKRRLGQELLHLLERSTYQEEHDVLDDIEPPAFLNTSLLAEAQFARVDELFCLTSCIFSQVSSKPGTSLYREDKISDLDPNSTYINFYLVWSVPYSMDQVLEAAWVSVVDRAAKKDCGRKMTPDDTGESMTGAFHTDTSILNRGLRGEITGHCAAKKFVNESQAAIVTNVSASMDKARPRSVEDFAFREDSWIRISRAPHHNGTEMSNIQISHRLHIRAETDRSATQRRKAAMMTQFVVAHIEHDITWRQDIIDNRLLLVK